MSGAASNVLTYTDSVMGSWSFGYDQLNRLVTAANTALPTPNVVNAPYPTWGQNLCWAYDPAGNRLQQTASNVPITPSNGACTFAPSGTNLQNVWATYNTQNQMTQTSAHGTVAPLYYDASGDVGYDGDFSYLYDAEGRICAVNNGVTPIAYVYDAAGNRVAKGTISSWSCDITANGFTQTASYVVDGGGQQLTELDGSNNWKHTNVWVNGKQIGTYDSSGLHFYFDDPLGTRRAQANAAGVLEAVYQSLPYGDDLTSAGPAGDPTENHFTGKERDSESSNDYFGARYYNSVTGRWLSPDWSGKVEPVPYAQLGNPQSLNLYAYVGDNPETRNDPSGHSGCSLERIATSCDGLSNNEGAQVVPEWSLISGGSATKKPSVSVKTIQFASFRYGKTAGVHIELLAKVRGSNYVDFNWIQKTVSTPGYGKLPDTPTLDRDPDQTTPFYWNPEEEADWNAKARQEGGSSIFHDDPTRPFSNGLAQSWHADLSLVGINRDGTFDTLKSYTYGFVLNDNKEFVQQLRESK